MLLHIAIGDSYGMGFEYADQNIKEHNRGTKYIQHPIHKIQPGSYTDDTQMSIAVAEYILEAKPFKDVLKLSDKFYEVYTRDKREGYSRGFQALLNECLSGKELYERVQTNGCTEKNGAAMRACPIGLLRDKETVKEFAEVQGSITHNGRGLIAAKATALAVWFYKNEIEGSLDNFLNVELGINENWFYDGRIESKNDLGMITVKGALTIVQTCSSFKDAIVESVGLSGDVDTVAAIVCGINSVRKDFDNSIPDHLFHTLENEAYGRDYLIKLDKKLNEINS